MQLDLSSFERALARLREGFVRYQQDIADTQIRDGLVQRFEFTYEIAHKTLKRYLELASATPTDHDAMIFPDLIRTANERGLLRGDWPAWRRYRDMRGRTSHAHDERVALEVVAGIPAFLEEATHLHDRIRDRLA